MEETLITTINNLNKIMGDGGMIVSVVTENETHSLTFGTVDGQHPVDTSSLFN
ncbi:hypothetical protein HK099_002807, partial [Clydaea vesicula]